MEKKTPENNTPKLLLVETDASLARDLDRFADDHVWVHDNRESLFKQYGKQWIAVRERKVIGHHPNLDRLLDQLPEPQESCVEFLSDEPLEMVL